MKVRFAVSMVMSWLLSAAALAAPMTIQSNTTRVEFDPQAGEIKRVLVNNGSGRFEHISDRGSLAIRTAMPNQQAQELKLGKLLNQEINSSQKTYRFEYEVEGMPQWRLIQSFAIDRQALVWDVKIQNPTSQLVGLEVDMVFENLYIHTRKSFNTNRIGLEGYPKHKYRANYIGEFPMTSVMDEQRDIGLTINSTFEVMRPLFWIEYDKNKPEKSVIFTNHYIGAGDGIEAHVSVDLFGHSGDWRPGMGMIFEHYKPYFTTSNEAIRKHEGNFLCAWYFISIRGQDLSPWDDLMIRNVEIIFYNPYYGLYAPDVDDDTPWTILMLERETLEQFKDNPQRQTTYRELNESIDNMRKHDVGSFVYFNYIDASVAMPELKERFADQIFINSDSRMNRGKVGERSLGNDNLYIMHMEPGSPWANWMEDQAKKLLKRVPNNDGYFIDMANGYGVYDNKHSDGVTVINGHKAYYDAIGIARIQKHLKTTIWDPAGKGIWANGPKFPEISRYVDASVAEIPGWTHPERDPGVPQIAFLSLDKPFVYMLAQWRKDNDPPHIRDIERHLKYALLYGGFVDSMIPMKASDKNNDRARIFGIYRPLFEGLVGKRWVFTPRPLTVPAPLYGNIFTYDNGNYTAYIFDKDQVLLNPPVTEHKDVQVTIRVTNAAKLRKAIYTCVADSKNPIELPIARKGGELTVTLPSFSVAGMIQLVAE